MIIHSAFNVFGRFHIFAISLLYFCNQGAFNVVYDRLSILQFAFLQSCIIKRYCEKRFVSKYMSTIGIDYGVTKYVVCFIIHPRV